MPTPEEQLAQLSAARADLAAARDAVTVALQSEADYRADLDEKRRSLDPSHPADKAQLDAAEAAWNQAVQTLNGARAAYIAKRSALRSLLNDWIGTNLSPKDEIMRLSADVRIVLLPVRIEARFDLAKKPAVLRVRIYPDEIFANSHETALTRTEFDAAMDFHTKFINSKDQKRDGPELWRDLLRTMSPERAAYVVRVMQPEVTPNGIEFPDDIVLRPADWSWPVEAVLPDRWIVVTYRGGEMKVHTGRPIREPLALSMDPFGSEADLKPVGGSTIRVDEELLWSLDYAEAEQAGMAVTIPLADAEGAPGTGGFDRLIVVGVKSSMQATDTPTFLYELFDAHHYTSGLALVPQGTPTNNTAERPSAFPRQDPEGVLSYEEEREPPPETRRGPFHLSETLGDGAWWAAVLGVRNGVISNSAGAYGVEVDSAQAMNRVLWPATLGYFIEHLLYPMFASRATRADVRNYFVEHVQGQGPTPAFRIGAVPYGVLPVLSLAQWRVRDPAEQEIVAQMLPTLKILKEVWKRASAHAVRIGRNDPDPLATLAQVLALHPSAQELRARVAWDATTLLDLMLLVGAHSGDVQRWLEQAGQTLMRVGHLEWQTTSIAHMVFDDRAAPILADLVAPSSMMSDQMGFSQDANPFDSVAKASFSQLRDDALDAPFKKTVLYMLLRHAALAEFAAAANQLYYDDIDSKRVDGPFWLRFGKQKSLADIRAEPLNQGRVPDGWEKPDQNDKTIGQYLDRVWSEDALPLAFPLRDFKFTLKELAILSAHKEKTLTREEQEEQLSTNAIARLLSQTLGVVSYRLDAWITSVAASRLQAIDNTTGTISYFGGYAWVEDLHPSRAPHSGGFVHAPSMEHARAAALLRNGYLSRSKENPQAYAFDLSSRRVRDARQMLDEIRAGQPLGAVLGYRFERGLRENHTKVDGLDAVRYALRRKFPLAVNKSGPPAGQPADLIAARNVVDGLALWTAYRDQRSRVDTDPTLPRPGTPQYQAVTVELQRLGEIVDAVADLTTAEAMFQLVRGNPTTAAANLDALASGAHPPDPEIARSAPNGVAVTHRVVLILGTPAPLPGNWPKGAARGQGAPEIENWVAQRLGKPEEVKCRVKVKTGSGDQNVDVSLDQLGLGPLDVVALAVTSAELGQGSSLDRRVRAVALKDRPGATIVAIDYTPSSGQRGFGETIELASAIGQLLARARTIDVEDFFTPGEAPAGRDAAEAAARIQADNLLTKADALVAELTTTRKTLNDSLVAAGAAGAASNDFLKLRTAIADASRFAIAMYPDPAAGTGELLALGAATLAELDRRAALADEFKGGTAARELLDAATGKLKAIFGTEFVATLALAPPNATELGMSLAARSTQLAGDQHAPERFIQQVALVREGLHRWRTVRLYSEALGDSRPRFDVLQLPFTSGERWLGMPLPDPPRGRVSYVALSYGPAPSFDGPVAGLMIDEWVEVIPSTWQETGVSFHYDAPGAEAPQAVLVAVPSSAGDRWTLDDLLATLNETIDLAKIRAVEPEQLDLGQLLPPILLAENLQNVTVSTNLSRMSGPPVAPQGS